MAITRALERFPILGHSCQLTCSKRQLMDAVKVSALSVLGPLFIYDQMLSAGAISCVVSVRLCGRLVVDNVMRHGNHSVHCLLT